MALQDYLILHLTEQVSADTFSFGYQLVLEDARANTSSGIPETDMECIGRVANGKPIVNNTDFGKFEVNLREDLVYSTETGELSLNWDTVNEMRLNILRFRRNSLLAALDLPFMIALEQGNTEFQTTITQRKQILRDLPVQMTANLTSNTTIVNASLEDRQTLIINYIPEELVWGCIRDLTG